MSVDYEWDENEPMVCFDCGTNGDAWVFQRCPKCGRFITVGKFQTNGLDEVRLIDWRCLQHGEIEPAWFWL